MESQGFVGNKMVKVDETQVSLGKDYDHPSFGWDNEYGNMQLKYFKDQFSIKNTK